MYLPTYRPLPVSRLMTVLGDFFSHEQFKMELMTVITSPPGSGDQRWHQGWRYLFHPDERLPPFAAVHSASCTVAAAAFVLHRASLSATA